ncbi:MAG: 4-(cytidine 5'-diphospho)-2-C-methyl-D-erythritol kinase [Treponema sp.]|nr:4-(cytidine 5'-diphospho)-2-C-methyl-D-erythritol kinase [Treponema sp.]
MPEFINELTSFAPAKVNLHLAVNERRSDGYHNLDSVFLAVNFGDTLNFSIAGGGFSSKLTEIHMTQGAQTCSIPVSDNIIFKAATLFREKSGFSRDIKIKVDKRIPVGGGLGGGSSDAACTLLSLNKMTGFPLNREQLLETAACLGSDVPFFIHETCCAHVTGRGEIIEPIDFMPLFLALVSPGFPSDTARAFRLLDEYRLKNPSHGDKSSLRFTEQKEKTVSVIEHENSVEIFIGSSYTDPQIPDPVFYNDFLDVFPEREKSVYNRIILKLRESGALFANLSGAGSACFGIFTDEKTAQNAAQSLRGIDGWFTVCCGTLTENTAVLSM